MTLTMMSTQCTKMKLSIMNKLILILVLVCFILLSLSKTKAFFLPMFPFVSIEGCETYGDYDDSYDPYDYELYYPDYYFDFVPANFSDFGTPFNRVDDAWGY